MIAAIILFIYLIIGVVINVKTELTPDFVEEYFEETVGITLTRNELYFVMIFLIVTAPIWAIYSIILCCIRN